MEEAARIPAYSNWGDFFLSPLKFRVRSDSAACDKELEWRPGFLGW